MRAISDKALKDRGWKISQTHKYDVNEVQAQELHKFKRKVFKVQR